MLCMHAACNLIAVFSIYCNRVLTIILDALSTEETQRGLTDRSDLQYYVFYSKPDVVHKTLMAASIWY